MRKTNIQHWNDLPDVLTVRDAAIILHMCETSVRQACVNGRLPAVKIGKLWRISKAKLRALFEEKE